MIMGGSISAVEGVDSVIAIFARQDGNSRSEADHETGM